MAWHITPEINSGYPFEDGFPNDFLTSFISDSSHQYPYSAWRIGSGVNNGYPWKYWWFEAPVSDSGDMETGGSQSNYPGGFTVGDLGGISDQFDDDDMDINTPLIGLVSGTITTALAGKIIALSSSLYLDVVGKLNNPTQDVLDKAQIIQTLYGANIYDGILLCKVFPFTLGSILNPIQPKIFGIYPLYEERPVGYDQDYLPGVVETIKHYPMGQLDLDIFQAWEVEDITYSIYLPYAGTFPLDVRSGETISVELVVDIISGIGEYFIKQNGQIIDMHKALIGYDMPVNLSQGAAQSNLMGFVYGAASKFMGAAGSILGGIPHPAAQAAGVAADIGSALTGGLVGHFDVNAPSVGGFVGAATYPLTRIIAKIPKMFNEGYGYHETQGANRSATYVNLSACSGFVQCKNYKSDIIIATEDEKREIESLMNAGVFL